MSAVTVPPGKKYNASFQQTMLRIRDPKVSVPFYEQHFGMKLVHKYDFPPFKFSLYFLERPKDGQELPATVPSAESEKYLWSMPGTTIELTHNWGTESDPNFKGYWSGNSGKDADKNGPLFIDNGPVRGFKVSHNALSGSFLEGDVLSRFCSAFDLDVSWNKFTGSLLHEGGWCKPLATSLVAHNNRFAGSLPGDRLNILHLLSLLDVNNNELAGTLPSAGLMGTSQLTTCRHAWCGRAWKLGSQEMINSVANMQQRVDDLCALLPALARKSEELNREKEALRMENEQLRRKAGVPIIDKSPVAVAAPAADSQDSPDQLT
mmetsp:Transcript_1572/g.3420  ORF Transcript_1572/g.3420 Transcript_1572/m.3420 type:complete len:320 (+) Transcript_1572:157-1116(+)